MFLFLLYCFVTSIQVQYIARYLQWIGLISVYMGIKPGLQGTYPFTSTWNVSSNRRNRAFPPILLKSLLFRQYRHFGVFPQGMQIGSDQYLLSLKGLLKRNLTTKCLAAHPCLISGSPRVQTQMNSAAAAPIIWPISQRQQCCSSWSPHCLLIIPVQSSAPPEHHCALSTSHPQPSLAANWESGMTSALPPWISMAGLYITHGMCLHMYHQTPVPHIT